MHHGNTTTPDGELILDTRWPQRMLCYCEDPDGDSAYVWADCEGDAIESLAQWNGHEGDDDKIACRRVRGTEYERIAAITDAFNEE